MIILNVGLKLPLDSLALFQGIPPAHRPHWPGQSPQNPETNLFWQVLNLQMCYQVQIHSHKLQKYFYVTFSLTPM